MNKPGAALTAIVFAHALAANHPQAPGTRGVDVIVEQADGAIVKRVVPEDLECIVDGARRGIEAIVPASGPVSIVLLMDLSWSVIREPVDTSDRQAREFLALLQGIERGFAGGLPVGDRGRVSWFASRAVVASEGFTSDRAELAAMVRRTLTPANVPADDAFGGTITLDAVARVATMLAAVPGRRAILLLTDGNSAGNRLSLEEAARLASATGVAVHVMMYDPDGFHNFLTHTGFSHDRLVPQLAALTGGVMVKDDRWSRWSWGPSRSPFVRLFEAIHATHQLRVATGDLRDGATVEVKPRNPKLRVHVARWLLAQ